MFFKREKKNSDLINRLYKQMHLRELHSNEYLHIYYGINVLRDYNDHRYFAEPTEIDYSAEKFDLGVKLKDIECLTDSKQHPSPLIHLRIATALSVAGLAAGIASLVLLTVFKNNLYAIMNHWLMFFTIMIPIIICGAILIGVGIGGIAANLEHISRWKYDSASLKYYNQNCKTNNMPEDDAANSHSKRI